MKKLAWILSTAVSLAATSACAPAGEAEEQEQALGSATLAISAIGPDGHRYRLLSGTTFVASRPDGEHAFSYPLFESMDRQTIEFEVGSYVAELQGADTGDGGILLLRDNPDGSSLTIVSARLVSPNPLPFTIRPGQSTQLTFRFAVPELGDVVFSAGSVDVGIDVESQPEPSHGSMFHVGGPALSVSDVFTDVTAVPGLQALADGARVGDVVSTNLGLDRVGDWRLHPEGFCADVQLGSTGASVAEPEINALLVQVLGARGSLCFIRESAGGLMLLNISREGGPTVYDPDFGLPDPIGIRVEGWGDPSESLVEGGVLRLSELDDPLAINGGGFTVSVDVGGNSIASVSFSGDMTIGVQP